MIPAKGDLPDAGKDVNWDGEKLDLRTGVRAEAVDDGRKEQRDGVERGDDARRIVGGRQLGSLCLNAGLALSHLM